MRAGRVSPYDGVMIAFSKDPELAEQQMHAVIFYLAAFGYVDGDFDDREKEYVRGYIRTLVAQRAQDAFGERADADRVEAEAWWTTHFHQVLDKIDAQIRADFDESVAEGESAKDFVIARLKLRCFELYKGFDDDNRRSLLSTIDQLMHADGTVHPSEQAFRTELFELLNTPVELDDTEVQSLAPGAVIVGPTTTSMPPRQANHPFFGAFECDYARDPKVLSQQMEKDQVVLRRTVDLLNKQREKGKGELGDAVDVWELHNKAPFLDGHVYVLPPKPDKDYELLVLGDLHGCYSCLKAALLQADFFGKVQAHRNDPEHNPEMKLVFLGDYIDRGRFSFSGILRTAMQLFLTMPEHVYLLRGNHEYYVEYNGRIYGGVMPSEALNSLVDVAPMTLFQAYKEFFDALPTVLLFGKTLFVHAGIPRDDTTMAKWMSLSSLNDPDIRFQMLWSDPSDVDYIPSQLQQANARFPFGRRQFRSFMSRLGCTTMIRGHERVREGFRKVYEDGDLLLVNLFSAGGETNEDLPPTSNYREVTPMALTIRCHEGISELSPFVIDYARYNDPTYNAFFRSVIEE